ncbi:glycosyltransferase [Rubrobacter taiwanensis]|jgi:glycosyltransferase involved in cell wall biosynthesis|uniref:4,4'-diaponeurosporenoate glycosyltransferase n=1 Tax=Rubrobacter taiwanensis TaxID=185139 RepID=A0A4R1BRX3_9ACTN|nr:glycosyltransferase [Rubrobacter taiwanensis]TCJ20543.1 glycosyltransferase [Rubrobacter taiwanensis]
MHRVSVVIPTLNEEGTVGALLADLSRQTLRPDEILVVDGGSRDGTARVVERFPGVRLLGTGPPVANQRNLGGRRAAGDVLVFLDADVRLHRDFLRKLLEEFERRDLDLACPRYLPYRSTLPIYCFHLLFNALFRAAARLLPSGAGHCIVIRRKTFLKSGGFDPSLKFDDIELIRRLGRRCRFGILGERVYVSDRRYREAGTLRAFATYLLLALIFATGRFRLANRVPYTFGEHGGPARYDSS